MNKETRINTSSPYTIDRSMIKRFDQRKNIFGRMLFDKQATFFNHSMYQHVNEIIAQKRPNYSHIDFARMLASWTVHDHFHAAFFWQGLQGAENVMTIPEFDKLACDNILAITQKVKETALLYGASKVGICEINYNWLYSHDMNGKAIVVPPEYKFAVVMVIAMERAQILQSPAPIASFATGIAYSQMAFCISCMAQFIRYLGYQAIPMGNDTALSIPLAIDAGLGQLGRLGLLITPEYGPCVRICKIFTDMPLVVDRPIDFGVTEFCRQCNLCVEACKANAISEEKEPSFAIACSSNNKGILRWAVNHDKCYQFWIKNGTDCSSCIAACPYTRGDKS
jgi:epoxyqueuosine reductase